MSTADDIAQGLVGVDEVGQVGVPGESPGEGSIKRDVEISGSVTRAGGTGPGLMIGEKLGRAAGTIGHEITLQGGLLDGDGHLGEEESVVVGVSGVVVEVLGDLGVVGDDQNTRGSDELGVHKAGVGDGVTVPESWCSLGENGHSGVGEVDRGAGLTSLEAEDDDTTFSLPWQIRERGESVSVH